MKKCFVLFPGKFKPVHSGHIALMEKYINSVDYDVELTIVISKIAKEGLDANTSKWFLDKIYAKNPKVHAIVSPDPSPIGTVYNMTGQKEFGDGIYAMGTSAKGGDIKRAEDFVKKFAEGQKYYTPGVEVIFFPVNPEPLMYTGRTDMYAEAPISSTIVRMDIRNNDFDSFRTAYIPMLESGLVDDKLLREYFEKLKVELLPGEDNMINDSINESMVLNEGGAAGHMDHPYDVNEFTFADLKELIMDLFAGRIHDVTEKLDGQNLFASVDEHGNTVFARTPKAAIGIPLGMQDIKTKWLDSPSVQHAFSNGADTINAVFQNVPNAAKFFNTPYKKWINLEIIDTENFNVIPYVESTVSFHEFKKIDENGEIVHDENNIKNMAVIQAAIDKTNKHIGFKAQNTPLVIFEKIDKGEQKAKKYIDKIDKILNKVNLPDDATIANYKVEGLCLHIEKSPELSFLSGDLLDVFIRRWVFNETIDKINNIVKNYTNEEGRLITSEEYEILKDFSKNGVNLVFKKIMEPLDSLFITLGNEILKSIDGLMNDGHEKEVIARIKREATKLKAAVENTDDEKSKLKIQQSLVRLAKVNNELNATEGIVFDFKGHKLKLTGSFAPLNQMMGVRFKYNKPSNVTEAVVITRRSPINE